LHPFGWFDSSTTHSLQTESKRRKITKHPFQNLAFTLTEVENTISPFMTYHGIKNKHDSVTPTRPMTRDYEKH
jgi:hypothetical protein